MEGLFRTYSAPIRRTLRRETRSIAEWREKGKYQPFDLAIAVEEMGMPDRAATWHGPSRKSAWSPASSEEYEEYDDTVAGSEYESENSYVYRTTNTTITVNNKTIAQDYFSAVPRTTTTATVGAEELFAEEPLAADVPEAELQSSRRRSIDLERQPLVLETKDDDAFVESIIQHLGDPTLDAPLEVTAVEEPKAPTPGPVKKVEESVDTSEPPSPEDIIEHSARPAPKPRALLSTRDRFLKAKKVLFTVDVLKKCIPPAPLPEDLIEGPAPQPKPKAVVKESVAPKAAKELGGVTFGMIKEVVEVSVPVVSEEKDEVAPATKVEEVVEEKTAEVMPAVGGVVEAPKEAIPEIIVEEAPKETTVEVAEGVESISPIEGGVSLSTSTPPVHQLPGSPQSVVRSDEGYLSGDSDSESDFGVSLPPDNYSHEASSVDDDAPLPEDIISNHKNTPAENEPYQHHCLLHGHFFPKAGPLRSAVPGEPFTPWISCDRCQRPRLCEAWQCSLLNQCGIIVCTPCHDELEYGVITKSVKPQELVLEAKVVGVKEGLEIGMQRGLKIGFEVGLAGKAKEIVARQERENAKRHAEEQPQGTGLQTYRSWEAVPKQAKRMSSMGF